MHIPDGYLSPATCAVLYGAALPFWYASLQRVKRQLTTRLVPSLSLFAAFSFVVMMFNLPLPGGTTGHAVGMTIATIVVGPAASILALSAALLIQALFFGDGGITTLGANCFNMAIVGSLVAFTVYSAIAGHSAITSRRRVIAAGVAGYAAINTSAFCTAIELGMQPIFYHDATGAPLYAPFPLHVALPAMMIGHLTIAGLAETVLSAGMIAYLQRTNPQMLQNSWGGRKKIDNPLTQEEKIVDSDGGWKSARALWLSLAAALLLTPLGVLAVGSAWGEWSAKDFAQAESRRQIAATSLDHAPPDRAPAGLERLASIWTAPFPSYAIPLVHSRYFGYLLSAMFGAGSIMLVTSPFRFRARITPRRPAEELSREIHGR